MVKYHCDGELYVILEQAQEKIANVIVELFDNKKNSNIEWATLYSNLSDVIDSVDKERGNNATNKRKKSKNS